MYFGEMIVLSFIMVCLYGLYEAAIEFMRRNRTTQETESS